VWGAEFREQATALPPTLSSDALKEVADATLLEVRLRLAQDNAVVSPRYLFITHMRPLLRQRPLRRLRISVGLEKCPHRLLVQVAIPVDATVNAWDMGGGT